MKYSDEQLEILIANEIARLDIYAEVPTAQQVTATVSRRVGRGAGKRKILAIAKNLLGEGAQTMKLTAPQLRRLIKEEFSSNARSTYVVMYWDSSGSGMPVGVFDSTLEAEDAIEEQLSKMTSMGPDDYDPNAFTVESVPYGKILLEEM